MATQNSGVFSLRYPIVPLYTMRRPITHHVVEASLHRQVYAGASGRRLIVFVRVQRVSSQSVRTIYARLMLLLTISPLRQRLTPPPGNWGLDVCNGSFEKNSVFGLGSARRVEGSVFLSSRAASHDETKIVGKSRVSLYRNIRGTDSLWEEK